MHEANGVKTGLQNVITTLVIAGVVGLVGLVVNILYRMAEHERKIDVLQYKVETLANDQFTTKDAATAIAERERRMDDLKNRLDRLERGK